MDIKTIFHDTDTNTVTIHVVNKHSPIVCQALEVRRCDKGNIKSILLDRIIHREGEGGNITWDIYGAFVTMIARKHQTPSTSL